MTDPVPQSSPSTKWIWTAAIVLLGIASVIFFLNADGDESDFPVTDAAITTTEERLNTQVGEPDLVEGAEQVNGITPEELAPEAADDASATDEVSVPVQPTD